MVLGIIEDDLKMCNSCLLDLNNYVTDPVLFLLVRSVCEPVSDGGSCIFCVVLLCEAELFFLALDPMYLSGRFVLFLLSHVTHLAVSIFISLLYVFFLFLFYLWSQGGFGV